MQGDTYVVKAAAELANLNVNKIQMKYDAE